MWPESNPQLLRAIVAASIATGVFLLAVWILVRVARLLTARVENAGVARDLRFRGFVILRGTQVVTTLVGAISILAWLVGLLAAYGWLTFVLTRFPATHEVGELLGSKLREKAGAILVAAARGIPGIIAVAFIFWIRGLAQGLLRRFFDAAEHGTVRLSWLHAETAAPTRRIFTAVLWIGALIAAYPYMPGSESEAFKNVGVLVGVMVSLGSSGVIGQAMSGLVVMYARALKAGDYVRIGEVEGTVTELGLMSTKVRTDRDEEVTLPSSVVVSSATVNYSRLARDHGVAITARVTIGYDVDWRLVHERLELAAGRTVGVRVNPKPFVAQTALDDFYASYTLHAYVDDPARQLWIRSDLHAHMQDALNEAGIQIMSPHYMADPPEKLGVSPEQRHTPGVKKAG